MSEKLEKRGSMFGRRLEYADHADYLEEVRYADLAGGEPMSSADRDTRQNLQYNRQATEWEPWRFEEGYTGSTYAYCPGCARLITAYGKNGRIRPHLKIDDFGGCYRPASKGGRTSECPGVKMLGEVVEGAVYVSRVDSLKWVRVQ
jgi:hypothetical protein